MKSSDLKRREFFRYGLGIAAAATAMGEFPAVGRGKPIGSVGDRGFFHLQQHQEKWFLVGPDGRPYCLRGANHYGDGTYMPWDLETRYGSKRRWREEVRDRHRRWRFNYLPPSIGPSEIPPEAGTTAGKITRTPEWPADDFADLEYPFTAFLDVPRQYMAGHNLPDVFSRDFRELVDRRCQEFVAPLRDNPQLIGYHFVQNPPWHPEVPSFDYWIEDTVKPSTPAAMTWADLMRRLYGDVQRWRETYGLPIVSFDEVADLELPLRAYLSATAGMRDQLAYMGQICEEWYKIFSESIRKYDPNHLILGDRNTLHLHPLPDYAIYRMRPYVDVLSVNVMGPKHVIYETMEQITPHWDGPIHLADTGAGVHVPGPIKSGYMAADLDEFEQVYRGLMEIGVEHPQVIGMGWCGYYENSTRSGLVDAANDQPLAGRVQIVTRWNTWQEEQYADVYRDFSENMKSIPSASTD